MGKVAGPHPENAGTQSTRAAGRITREADLAKRLQRARWRREQRRRTARKKRRRELHKRLRARPRVRRNPRRALIPVAAPGQFSFVRNPAAAITFVNRLREVFLTNRDVKVDLSAVKELTSDAVLLVLLSRLSDPAFVRGRHFQGNEPKDVAARQLLNQSGFFQFVWSRLLKEPPESGRIMRKVAIQGGSR